MTGFARRLDGVVFVVVVVDHSAVVHRIRNPVLVRRNSVGVIVLVDSVVDSIRRLRMDLVMLNWSRRAVMLGRVRMLSSRSSVMRLSAEMV